MKEEQLVVTKCLLDLLATHVDDTDGDFGILLRKPVPRMVHVARTEVYEALGLKTPKKEDTHG